MTESSSQAHLIQELPHRPPAQLVHDVIEIDDHMIRCEGSVPPGSPYGDARSVSSIATADMGAQAAAIHLAFLRPSKPGRRPGAGYVVRIRDLRLVETHFPTDQTVQISVSLAGGAPPLWIYRITARLSDETVLLTAQLSILVDESPERG